MSVLINPYALVPPPPAATREYRALNTTGLGSGTSVLTVAGCDVGSAAPGRYVFAGVHLAFGVNRTLTAASIGGAAARINALVKRETSSGTWQHAAVISALLEAGSTANIALTFDGTVSSSNGAVISTHKVLGIQSNVEIDSDSLSTDSATASKNLVLDVQQGGLLFDMVYPRVNSSPAASYTYTGCGEDYDQVYGSLFSLVGGSLEVDADETDHVVTLTGSKSWRGIRVAASFR